jgi:DNA modification methylase
VAGQGAAGEEKKDLKPNEIDDRTKSEQLRNCSMSREIGYLRALKILRQFPAVDETKNSNDFPPLNLKNSSIAEIAPDSAEQSTSDAGAFDKETKMPATATLRAERYRPAQRILKASVQPKRSNGAVNKLEAADRSAHNWYRFVLSFPPHLVRDYLHRFGADARSVCLDPFCGTATTLVECKKLGIPSIGIESHPMSFFAGQVKTDWTLDPQGLLDHAHGIAERCLTTLARDGISDEGRNSRVRGGNLRQLPKEAASLLLGNSISPLPLHKTLILLDHLREASGSQYHRAELLALAQGLVTSIGNLHFGPEVGVGVLKADAAVVGTWLANVNAISRDLVELRSKWDVSSAIIRADSREIVKVLRPSSVDLVITSPPYPNEKDYTRTTRLESVLLGVVQTKAELRAIKRGLVRSNTRSVYKDDNDDIWIKSHAEIQKIASSIERRRIALNKTSGFERMYARLTKLYFGGMARHLEELKTVLKPGAHLAYVVGDQASYLRVMIRTGQLLADIAKSQGYEVLGIDLFRTRLSTATGEQLREEAVLLRWPG